MSLQNLPPELVEMIVVLLPLRDICSLRLSSSELSAKASQDHFKENFCTKRAEITETRLRAFVAATKSSLGCQLRDLTLIGPVYGTQELEHQLQEKVKRVVELDDEDGSRRLEWKDLTEEEIQANNRDLAVLRQRGAEQLNFQRSGKAVELISQAFSHLAGHGVTLRELRLEVEIYEDRARTPLPPLYGGIWEHIWASAAHVTHTLLESLASSGLRAHDLNLFNSDQMQRCSLACNELTLMKDGSDRLRPSLSCLGTLSMSISDKIIAESDGGTYRPHEEIMEEASSRANFVGFSDLLSTCTNLRELDVNRYSLGYRDQEIGNAHSTGFLEELKQSNLPVLEKLSLSGFAVSEELLLQTLQSLKSVKRLSLRYIGLQEGSFGSILNYCATAMEEVELDSLFEPDLQDEESGEELILFEAPWALPTDKTKYKSGIYPGLKCHYIRKDGRSTRATAREIKYHSHQGRTMDTASTRNWRQDLRNCFGPPGRSKPACVREHFRPEHTWAFR